MMPNLQLPSSFDEQVRDYLANGKTKLIYDLEFFLTSNQCAENTLKLIAEKMRAHVDTTFYQIELMINHNLPAVRKIGRYTLAEQSDVSMI
jgi:hypothetical protein